MPRAPLGPFHLPFFSLPSPLSFPPYLYFRPLKSLRGSIHPLTACFLTLKGIHPSSPTPSPVYYMSSRPSSSAKAREWRGRVGALECAVSEGSQQSARESRESHDTTSCACSRSLGLESGREPSGISRRSGFLPLIGHYCRGLGISETKISHCLQVCEDGKNLRLVFQERIAWARLGGVCPTRLECQ